MKLRKWILNGAFISFGMLALIPSSFASAILLEVKSSGGFVPVERSGWESGVRVTADGNVTKFSRSSQRGKIRVVVVAKLASSVIRGLEEILKSLPQEGEVKYPEDAPRCTDAPSTIYKAPLFSSQPFSKHIDCRTGYLEDFSAAERLKKLLDAFVDLPNKG